MRLLSLVVLLITATLAQAQAKPHVHLWFEPEWFEGVKGSFAYWTGTAKPTGAWGVAGPGIGAEWSQGGESEWNSMGAAAEETSARCQRDFVIPRSGNYRIWVRYVDHRKKVAPFRVRIEQGGKEVFASDYGHIPVVPVNDEYQLYWGFSFGWGGSSPSLLTEGPARLIVSIDKKGEAWRQVDAILITDDKDFTPNGRAKPKFAYQDAFDIRPTDGAKWRGSRKDFVLAPESKRKEIAKRDFSMWTGIDADLKWWGKQDLGKLSLYDIYFQFSPPADIKDKFHKQFAGKKDIPIHSWPNLLPGFYLGGTPDLSDGSPVRQWLEKTKTPFFIMTNYASGSYTEKNGPGTYTALTGPLADQFMGYIHGEAIGTVGISLPETKGLDRRAYVDALPKSLRDAQAEAWSKIYKTKVSPDHWSRGIACLSVDSIALAHLYHESGARTVGYEIDATNVHAPMRIAFERGAARQYGGAWINYASGNFGDSCNYFTHNPHLPRSAQYWYHSRYSITDGVSAAWYRKLYYLNYLGGASAIYWEQNLTNQWLLPGPGTHPIQLSPFGRATEDFQAFVSRLPDRGEPYTPIAILLSHGHAYERVNYSCKMLHHFQENKNDIELRELFNVCWHPSAVLEGQPASPDVQSMPSGVYGDIFDVLVDRPAKAKAIHQYPVVWAAGDVKLDGAMLPIIEEYVKNGGTLVTTITQARDLPATLTGFVATGKTRRAEEWRLQELKVQPATPFEVMEVKLQQAERLASAGAGLGVPPLITKNQVGKGSVIVVLAPHGVGLDERAHPCLPALMNALTEELLPIEVLVNSKRPAGEIMYSFNKTKDGWLVALFNQRGIDKTQNGIARVDRTKFVDVVLRTKLNAASAREMTEPRDLAVKGGEIGLRVAAGDLQVVAITTK